MIGVPFFLNSALRCYCAVSETSDRLLHVFWLYLIAHLEIEEEEIIDEVIEEKEHDLSENSTDTPDNSNLNNQTEETENQ